MIKKVFPIDFSSFKNGTEYYILNPRNNQIFSAKIDHFRKGLAIAHTADFDCIINIKCEIVYIPSSYYSLRCEMGSSRISRNIEGKYIVSCNRDISAPGKDWFYQNEIESILDESCKALKGDGYLFAPIYDYPMQIPYERGKIIRHDNKFVDLETLKIIYEYPQYSTLNVKSEVINGWCDVEDEQYFKKLLVEVNNGKIVSYKDITGIESFFINGKKENSFLSETEIINSFTENIFYKSITSEIDELIEKYLNNPYGNLSENCKFFEWIKFLKQISLSYKDLVKKEYYFKNSFFEIAFLDDFYIIKCSSKIYIYNLDGHNINNEPYSHLTYIKDSENCYPNKCFFYYSYLGCCCEISGNLSIDKSGIIKEYPYRKFFERDKYDQLCYENISPYNADAGDIAYFDKTKKKYYDLEFKEITAIETDSINVETVIENYFYLTPDKSVFKLNNCVYQNYIHPFVENKKVIIPSKLCSKKTIKEINNNLGKRNKYVRDIHYIENLSKDNSNSKFYIFDYQPFGQMNMRGEFKYDINPETIIL